MSFQKPSGSAVAAFLLWRECIFSLPHLELLQLPLQGQCIWSPGIHSPLVQGRLYLVYSKPEPQLWSLEVYSPNTSQSCPHLWYGPPSLLPTGQTSSDQDLPLPTAVPLLHVPSPLSLPLCLGHPFHDWPSQLCPWLSHLTQHLQPTSSMISSGSQRDAPTDVRDRWDASRLFLSACLFLFLSSRCHSGTAITRHPSPTQLFPSHSIIDWKPYTHHCLPFSHFLAPVNCRCHLFSYPSVPVGYTSTYKSNALQHILSQPPTLVVLVEELQGLPFLGH